MITTYHNISFGTQTVPEQIPVVQGDTGREIVFILTDFTIPEGATATYYVQKPSGEAVYNTATISENNIIVPLTAQSIIEVGENDMQVRVILDDDIVTSFRAILMVRPFLGIGAVESSTEINIFDQAVEDAKDEIAEAVEEAIIEVHENALAFYVTDEASGAIATFPDGADNVPVKALTVEIEPVQSGSGDPSPSNVRPISGWSQANVTRTGKNLIDPSKITDGKGLNSNGNLVDSQTSSVSDYISVKPGEDYYLSYTADSTGRIVCFYNASKTFLEHTPAVTGGHSFTVPSNTAFCRVAFATASKSTAMLEVGDTASTYEPFTGSETFTIDLDGTRYGGTLDVGTGVLTVDTVGKVFNGTEEWGVTGYVAYTAFPDGFVQQTSSANSKCSHFVISGSSVNSESEVGKYDEFGSLRFNRKINGSLLDLDGWKSYLSTQNTNGTPVTVINKLATPLTVQLTAEEVTTLLGQNCIFADCGDVTVSYRADTRLYIDKLLNA